MFKVIYVDLKLSIMPSIKFTKGKEKKGIPEDPHPEHQFPINDGVFDELITAKGSTNDANDSVPCLSKPSQLKLG